MASKAFLIAVLIAAITAPAFATDYIVGDDAGWRLGVNYTEWANGKTFKVGDTLAFAYNKEFHSVAKVNATDFQKCVESNSSSILQTGHDLINLAAPGKLWYICSIKSHCSLGMKLAIDVAAAPASYF